MARTGLPRFCNKCGKELVTNEMYRKYDVYSGEPVDIVVTVMCPSYNILSGRKHFNSRIDIVDGQISS